MTAPDQPNPKEILSSCQPDLRDRIAEALALHLNGPASDGRGWYRTEADRIDCYARADAVMAEVQPELDAKDAEIAQQAADADRLDQLLIDERATTARLGRELGRLRDQQNGHQT